MMTTNAKKTQQNITAMNEFIRLNNVVLVWYGMVEVILLATEMCILPLKHPFACTYTLNYTKNKTYQKNE